jgi:NADH-quinone oxidoreductase subunit F
VSTILIPELSAHWDEADSFTLDGYKRTGGYQALSKALAMDPDQVIQTLKDSALRGRGGAGFPTGVKWGFIPQGDGKPHYLVVNADESEPGACKDMPTMLNNPQALIEGIVIACYAIRADKAFIYVRGEALHVARRLQLAVAEAYDSGAGAYICGEETALLDSLEGLRGQPRLKPPFPAVAGLYACPTVVNNVESIATVPYILQYGAAEFTRFGTEKSKGFGLFSLSGHVTTPGQYEAPLGTTLRELLGLAGGIRSGQQLKFWTPGGSSTPLFTDQHLDVPLDYESVAAAGSMLGTRSVQLFDDTTCVVRVVLRWIQFYEHESCGKCTPCREGSFWVRQLLQRLERGDGTEADLDKLLDICDNITGRAFCALGDSIQAPVASSIKYFRDEYIEHQRLGGCPFDPAASTLFALETAR